MHIRRSPARQENPQRMYNVSDITVLNLFMWFFGKISVQPHMCTQCIRALTSTLSILTYRRTHH